MIVRRIAFYFSLAVLFVLLVGIPTRSASPVATSGQDELITGRNVNMVSGTSPVDGDPYLQRQNEPSMAVSTRNPLHLLAGANDYRLVDMPQSEGPLPGIPEGTAAGDAWLGVYWSLNGGESWKNTLLPGYLFDSSDEGANSPLFGFGAASDPTVRAGANGLFFYSGIVFDRIEHGRSAIFVARFIDNNVTEVGEEKSTCYLDTRLIDEGNSGQFADKPWIAVDMPRYGSETVPIYAPDTPVQDVARYNVYIVYSIFLGGLAGGDQSKIMFARSTDCGTTWQRPIKISESQHINQGTTIAVSPKDGRIYLAWRRFSSASETAAIMACVSDDFGQTFSKAVEVNTINPFDQLSEVNRFRTYAFPTLAVDENGIVYVAWSDRDYTPEGDARVVIAASEDGANWTTPQPINNYGERGHQIMPSLTYAAGRLMMTWYDTLKSEGGPDVEISDPGSTGKRHTMDVWIAQAAPSAAGFSVLSNPVFLPPSQVSRYIHWVATDEWGEVKIPVEIVKKESNPPNFPLFMGGTRPFFGDYIDIASAPTLLFDISDLDSQVNGQWRFNTQMTDPATAHVTWTDNRDVNPPPDDRWDLYNPPYAPGSTTPCTDGTRTGMRNQNIYTSHITRGIKVGSPANTKPLITYRRSFLVFVKNLTEHPKHMRLTIEKPSGMEATFWEFGPPQDCEPPLLSCGDEVVDVEIAAYSSITLTVFVQPFADNPYAMFKVGVYEIGELGNIVYQEHVVLNPDPVNTRILPVLEEYHTPSLAIESPALVNITDPTILSQGIVYDPNLDYILNFCNPDIVTPAFRSPAFRSGSVVNPAFRSSAVGDWPDGEVTDISWRITNNNETTSAFSFLPVGDPTVLVQEGIAYQLLIYRVSTTPVADGCELLEEEHHELISKVESPAFRSPAFRSPAFRSPAFRSNSLSLAPGETAVCTLRLIDPDPYTTNNGTGRGLRTLGGSGNVMAFTPQDYASTVAAVVVPQAANPGGIIDFAASLYIISQDLSAWVNEELIATLEAYGGTPNWIENEETPDLDDDIWKYDNWSLVAGPAGLTVSPDGIVNWTPPYDPNVTYPHTASFVVEVRDQSNPQQVARREFSITVNCQFHPIVVKPGEYGMICHPTPEGDECFSVQGFAEVPHGESVTFTVHPDDCFHADVTVIDDGITQNLGSVENYTFEDVRRDDNEIQASFQPNTYTISATATAGGTISPSGDVPVLCKDNKTFTLSAEEGYLLEDVLVDGVSQGPVTSYTFYQVVSNHAIHGVFKKLETWVRRYNNSPVNGDDEASSLGVDGSGNVFVTGRSQGNATGFDYLTLKYDGLGNTVWGIKYNNPETNADDEASRLGLDSAGNVYVTGYSIGRTTGPDCYTLSYDPNGVPGWVARFDGPAHEGDKANVLAIDPSQDVYVAGYSTRGMPKKHADFVTLKYDGLGNLNWDKQYDDRRNGTDEISAIAVDGEGSVYITGRSEDSLTKKDVMHFDYYTIKYDANTGQAEWGARYDNAPLKGADEPAGIAVDAQGNVYVTGRSQGATGFDAVTVKYNPSGNQLWVHRYDHAGGADEATGIAVDGAGNVYVTGRSQGNSTGFDYFTIKYAFNVTDGQPEWSVRYNNESANGADEAAAIAVDGSGNVYVTGRSQGSATGFDYFTIKYDNSGTMVWRVRYNHSARNGDDEPRAIVVDPAGNVYVTGRSQGVGSGFDYATVKYEQIGQ